jgi:hypothetical protein
MTLIDTLQNTMKRRRRMAREPMELGGGVAEATSRNPSTRVVERQGTKSALLLSLLVRPEGATIAQVVQSTGWLPHSARAALTGLKKKGHTIASEKPDRGERVYRVTVLELTATDAAEA